MEYAVAAYVLVLGALVLYGARLHATRRALVQREARLKGTDRPSR
ncbi:MAG: hypothetical protein VX546_05170 [Myxococcota bacterium]|nr:hypothetical protein [Myxococcota bacterium]